MYALCTRVNFAGSSYVRVIMAGERTENKCVLATLTWCSKTCIGWKRCLKLVKNERLVHKIESITGVMFMMLIETWKFHKLRAKGNLTHSNHYGVTACFWTLSEIFTSWGFIITNAFSDYKYSGQTKWISHDSEASYLLLLLAFKIVMLWKCWFSILVIHSVL